MRFKLTASAECHVLSCHCTWACLALLMHQPNKQAHAESAGIRQQLTQLQDSCTVLWQCSLAQTAAVAVPLLHTALLLVHALQHIRALLMCAPRCCQSCRRSHADKALPAWLGPLGHNSAGIDSCMMQTGLLHRCLSL